MKKIGLLTREKIREELKDNYNGAQGCFFVSFHKIGAFALNSVRNNLYRSGAKVMVTKNTLIQKTFKDLGFESLDNCIDQETGVVFAYNDIVEACKILVDFEKENENFQVKGGILQEKAIDDKEVKNLAKLPPREVLLGMAVSGLASPITGFMNALNQVILKFVWVVQEIKNKKQ